MLPLRSSFLRQADALGKHTFTNWKRSFLDIYVVSIDMQTSWNILQYDISISLTPLILKELKVDPVVKFVLYPDNSGMWRVQAVTAEGTAFTNRLGLLEALRWEPMQTLTLALTLIN